ncbi:MAG: histidine kinase [Burkholderiaceae bacterium]|nr:histidine kinase [Burkholderiaceae bacterium]
MNERIKPTPVLDEPLPLALIRRFGGWGGLSLNYPVFSPTWFRYKILSFLLAMVLYAIVLIGAGFMVSGKHVWYLWAGELALNWIEVSVLIVLGRWLATRIYRRHWPQRKEAIGVAVALLIGIACATVISENDHLTKYDKEVKAAQAAANAQAQPAATAKHEADKVEKDEHSSEDHPDERSFSRVIWLALVIGLGGPLDFIRYFRQRRAMQDAALMRELERAKEGRTEAELRLSVLAAQIEPHFLFNTLTGVRSAIRSDPERGIAIIDRLVEYLRATIPQMRNDAGRTHVDLGSQLDAARAYLGVMHLRLPRLSYDIVCDPDLLSHPVPPLMLISLVENAVKHGIELKPGPAHIEVYAARNGKQLEIAVADDGAGFTSAAAGSGIGLANIRERLSQLYGDAASLSLKARPEGGVIAAINLPFEEN